MARSRRNGLVERKVHGPAAFRYEFNDRGAMNLVYHGLRSPDGHILLKLDTGKSSNYSYPKALPPAQMVVRSAEDALNQAIRRRSEASNLFRNAREGGFYERMGRLSTETRTTFRELELEADILEDLASTLEKRIQMGAHINPDYTQFTDEELIDIVLGERAGDANEATKELRRRGIIDDLTEMMFRE